MPGAAKVEPSLAYPVTTNDGSGSPFVGEGTARFRRSGQCFAGSACLDLARATDCSTLIQVHASLDTLRALLWMIGRLSARPGRRTPLLSSSGFLTNELRDETARVAEAALHAHVVIHRIDAKMLWTRLADPAGKIPGLTWARPEAFSGEIARCWRV